MPARLTPNELNYHIANGTLGVEQAVLKQHGECLPSFQGKISTINLRFALHRPVAINPRNAPNTSVKDIRIDPDENMVFVPINNGTNKHFSLLTLIKNEDKEDSYNAYLLDPKPYTIVTTQDIEKIPMHHGVHKIKPTTQTNTQTNEGDDGFQVVDVLGDKQDEKSMPQKNPRKNTDAEKGAQKASIAKKENPKQIVLKKVETIAVGAQSFFNRTDCGHWVASFVHQILTRLVDKGQITENTPSLKASINAVEDEYSMQKWRPVMILVCMLEAGLSATLLFLFMDPIQLAATMAFNLLTILALLLALMSVCGLYVGISLVKKAYDAPRVTPANELENINGITLNDNMTPRVPCNDAQALKGLSDKKPETMTVDRFRKMERKLFKGSEGSSRHRSYSV